MILARPPMTPDQMIQELFYLGHFNNPRNPTGVQAQDLPTLTLNDKVVKTAVKSYQDMMGLAYDTMALGIYGRAADVDGIVGPLTSDLFRLERCGFPDYPSVGMEATGSGSWGACDPKYPNDHIMYLYVNKSGMPSFLGSKDDPNSIFEQVIDMVIRAYAKVNLRIIRVDSPPGKNGSTLTFENLRGSTIGLAIVPGSFSCGMRPIWLKLNPNYKPSAIFHQWCRLMTHELFHNCGSGHLRGGIMNPSIVGGTFEVEEILLDVMYPRCVSYYGKGEIILDGPTPPPPGPGPSPGVITAEGEITIKQDGQFVRRYSLADTQAPGGF